MLRSALRQQWFKLKNSCWMEAAPPPKVMFKQTDVTFFFFFSFPQFTRQFWISRLAPQGWVSKDLFTFHLNRDPSSTPLGTQVNNAFLCVVERPFFWRKRRRIAQNPLPKVFRCNPISNNNKPSDGLSNLGELLWLDNFNYSAPFSLRDFKSPRPTNFH